VIPNSVLPASGWHDPTDPDAEDLRLTGHADDREKRAS
jgi:hypothetical protein